MCQMNRKKRIIIKLKKSYSREQGGASVRAKDIQLNPALDLYVSWQRHFNRKTTALPRPTLQQNVAVVGMHNAVDDG